MLPDVVVTDIAMPELNGLEAARRLRVQRPVLGVVFITVHSEPQMVDQAMALGPCSYVLKSDAGDDLLIRFVIFRFRFLKSAYIFEGPGGNNSAGIKGISRIR